MATELKDQIEMLPTNIEQSGRLFKEENTKLEKLFGLQASVDRIEKLKSEVIPKIKQDIKKFEGDLSAAQEEIKKTRPDLEDVKEKLGIVQKMIGDMSMLDQAVNDLEQTQKELQPLQQSLSTSDNQNDISMEDLQKQRKEFTNRDKVLNLEIERKERICREREEELQRLQQKEIEVKQTELNLQADIQRSDALKNRVKELTETIKQLKETKDAKEKLLIPIEGKIKHAEDERNRSKLGNKEKLDRETKQYDSFEKKFGSIERVSNELQKLATKNLEFEIGRNNETLVQLKEEQKKWVSFI